MSTAIMTCCNAHAARPPVAARRAAIRRNSTIPRVAAPQSFDIGQKSGPASLYTEQLPLVSQETVRALESELDNGASVRALRRFNDNLRSLTAENCRDKLRPVMNELAYNLESFNPAFTAVLLKVQSTIGVSDYVRRDMALKSLIQPLAGEYGMHNGEPQSKTHRELFASFYESLMGEPLVELLREQPAPAASVDMFRNMMRDITLTPVGRTDCQQASYAMGYNLAIEYLADYEKTWMLDSFRHLDQRFLAAQGRDLDWVFLEVHAEGEAEHAAIGHNAVLSFVPEVEESMLRQAMQDHDRDFSAFYNHLADMLE